MKTIPTARGRFIVYHVSEAGSPDAHDIEEGEWFFQPDGAEAADGEVWSPGYPTEAAAEQAAKDFTLQTCGEWGEEMEF